MGKRVFVKIIEDGEGVVHERFFYSIVKARVYALGVEEALELVKPLSMDTGLLNVVITEFPTTVIE